MIKPLVAVIDADLLLGACDSQPKALPDSVPTTSPSRSRSSNTLGDQLVASSSKGVP
jgi:hypothetical protein